MHDYSLVGKVGYGVISLSLSHSLSLALPPSLHLSLCKANSCLGEGGVDEDEIRVELQFIDAQAAQLF